MGVLWTVWPLDDEMKSWLDEMEVEYPLNPSRFPTGAEIKEVLSGLDEYDVEINDNGPDSAWQAMIAHKKDGEKGPWTLLNINEYTGDAEQQELWFEKGWPELIELVLGRLAAKCGPLVLIPDTGGDPTVVTK
jgi:hypothetical protein